MKRLEVSAAVASKNITKVKLPVGAQNHCAVGKFSNDPGLSR